MVSRQVSSIVSLETVRRERRTKSSSPPSGTPKPQQSRLPPPGRNLVRSGNVYLFQVRWPKQLDPERRAAPIRISLGACPHKEARRQADLLIGYARQLFGRTGIQGVSDEPENDVTKDTSPSFEEQLEEQRLQGELVGELRAFQRIISSPPPSDSPADQKMFAAMRGFVQLSREISDPENANPLVVDNFETLQAKYTSDLEAALTEKDSAARTADPREETARRARALAERTGISADYTGAPEKPTSALTLPNSFAEEMHKQSVLKAEPAPRTLVAPKEADTPSPVATVAAPAHPIDENDTVSLDERVPAYKLDRRLVERPLSNAPLFSKVAKKYLDDWEERKTVNVSDVTSARTRCRLFAELIGDHPADTYVGADLQAFVELLRFYPANQNVRGPVEAARETISRNSDLHVKPLSKTTIQTQYASTVKRIIGEGATDWNYQDPLATTRVRYPKGRKNNKKAKTTPLSFHQVSTIFRTGVDSGLLDEAMLPLLGHLTGRRIAVLTYTRAQDIFEKFPGVWVIQPAEEAVNEETDKNEDTPWKTDESGDYFVLHRLLEDIGFIQWAVKQDGFIFKELMRLQDPAKSASSYMGRLFEKAGVKSSIDRNREVFHSLRGGNIDELREEFKPRETRLQVGHALTADPHDLYGFQTIPERLGRRIYNRPLEEEIDFSPFIELDFEKLSQNKRKKGRKSNIS